MPFIKTIHLPKVTHIGHLDRDLSMLEPGRDGPSLAVTDRPDLWREITRANAPEITLFNPTALWVDAFAFSPNCTDDIAAWALVQGYISPCISHMADWVDPDTGRLHNEVFETHEAAVQRCQDPKCVIEMEGYRLSPRALKRLGRWSNPVDWHGAILILYTREVIIPKRPLVVGIWWAEVHDPASGTAPNGQLMPEGLRGFEVEDAHGDMVPLHDAYPQLQTIGARPLELVHIAM